MKSQVLMISALFVAPAFTSCQSTDAGFVERLESATISHDVFFTLKPEAASDAGRLANACMALREIPGVVHLTAGLRAEAATRDVNEQDYHVALHVEFEDQAAYDGYGPHPAHQALLANFGEMFETVVVYDANINQWVVPTR